MPSIVPASDVPPEVFTAADLEEHLQPITYTKLDSGQVRCNETGNVMHPAEVPSFEAALHVTRHSETLVQMSATAQKVNDASSAALNDAMKLVKAQGDMLKQMAAQLAQLVAAQKAPAPVAVPADPSAAQKAPAPVAVPADPS